MKKTAAILLLISMIFLVSCSRTVKMKFSDDGTLTGGNSEYRYAPVGYEPTYQGEEYAVIKGTLEEKLYRIGSCDPEKWLTTEYSGAATLVYYSTDITLPTLSEMAPVSCFVCEQDINSFSVCTLGVEAESADSASVESERETIAALVSAIAENDEEQIWPRSDVSESYSLKFYSPDWEAIYYNVTYAICGDEKVLHDSVTGNTVLIGGLLDEYLENTYYAHNDS